MPMAAAKISKRNFITPARKRAMPSPQPGRRFTSRLEPPTGRLANHFEILIRVSHFGGG
jgi:hypothetical protein